MNRIVILGAGGFAREVASWVQDDQDFLGSDSIVFLDDNPGALDQYPHWKSQHVGSIEGYAPRPGDRTLMGIADPKAKKVLASTLIPRGATFANFIHPSAIVSRSAAVGEGTVICPRAVIAADAHVGRFVTVNLAATVGHDAAVGDFCSLMSHVDVTGFAVIEQGCFLGSHASVLPNVVVGRDAVVGAGSIVIRRVLEATTVLGVPARRVALTSRPEGQPEEK